MATAKKTQAKKLKTTSKKKAVSAVKKKTSAKPKKAAATKAKATTKKVVRKAKAPAKKTVSKKVAAKSSASRTTIKKAATAHKKPVIKAVIKKAQPKKTAYVSAALSNAGQQMFQPSSVVENMIADTIQPMMSKMSASIKGATPFSFNELAPIIPTPKSMEKIMNKSKTQYDKIANDANELSREGIDAFVKSGTIFAKGCEDIMRTSMSLAQGAAEKQAQFFKDAMSSKTLNEWTDVQSRMAQANFDEFMSTATKISEMSVKILSDSVEPFNDQMSKSMKKATNAMAA